MGLQESHHHAEQNVRPPPLLVTYLTGRSGRASLFEDDLMLISNLNDGLDIYSLHTETGTLLDEIKYNIDPAANYEVQCSFANGGKWLVVGGTDGYIRVFERSSQQLLHLMAWHGAPLVQTIVVCVSVVCLSLLSSFALGP